ncbi:MAG: Mor transcription activator family protein [Mariprofundaceae bacterium]|nr:Mor transcription activator family protein [Mariprofundaceae bacterium]
MKVESLPYDLPLIAEVAGVEATIDYAVKYGVGDVYLPKCIEAGGKEVKLLVEHFGESVTRKILKKIGGGIVYIPNCKLWLAKQIAKKVFNDRMDYKSGLTVVDIARKYGMTSRNVRRIVASKRNEKPSAQVSMF